MWCTWTTLLVVSCALVTADEAGAATTGAPATTDQPLDVSTAVEDATAAESRDVATTRAPARTLDRQAAELAWRTWLQSAESGNQNGPPRRITTKSLFITPLVCPKGQRLDRNGCVEVVTVNKDDHERILLEQLNALFPSSSTDVVYDYGEDEPGPLQLSIPIGLEPQAAPLHNQEPSAQAQELQLNYVKKDGQLPNTYSSIEAELELLKLQNNLNNRTNVFNDLSVINALHHSADKPKRDSPSDNSTETISANNTETGQKELVYGHVNVDPILLNINLNQNSYGNIEASDVTVQNETSGTNAKNSTDTSFKITDTVAKISPNKTYENLKKDQTKLNPENDYSDIGEAIKLISRYAEVSTDDNFNKDQMKHAVRDDSILGTRTKLQYRRNNSKPSPQKPIGSSGEQAFMDKMSSHSFYPKNEPFYRYPWQSQHAQTPPPNYPFRHLQDYWPGRNHIGGVYNTHGNPRRHHHSYPHYFRPRGYYQEQHPGLQEPYSEQYQGYPHRLVQRHIKPVRSQMSNQGLYSLLGLKHWFSSEETSKR